MVVDVFTIARLLVRSGELENFDHCADLAENARPSSGPDNDRSREVSPATHELYRMNTMAETASYGLLALPRRSATDDLKRPGFWRRRLRLALATAAMPVLLAPAAWGQGLGFRPCPDGAVGPALGDPTPFTGGMCDLGALASGADLSSLAATISKDGDVVAGWTTSDRAIYEAFLWREGGAGMQGLGLLSPDPDGFSFPTAISLDGSVVVGQSVDLDPFSFRSFRWTEGGGMQDLGTLRGDSSGDAYPEAISADGAVIVGFADSDAGSLTAFRWVEGGGGMQSLGALAPGGGSRALAVSADGVVIVGAADIGGGLEQAFHWTETTGMRALGSLARPAPGASEATAVSADGRVVVGWSDTDAGAPRAFRWLEGGAGMEDLGSLSAGGGSRASNVSGDGAVIVGAAVTDAGVEQAFRWTEAAGMQGLGSFGVAAPRESAPADLSADGRVVVGFSETDDGARRAFRWSAETGVMQDLGSLRTDNGGASEATAVSADGAVVVGLADTDDGRSRAFVWRTRLQDLANLYGSFEDLANDTAAAVSTQQDRVGAAAAHGCASAARERCLASTLLWDSNGSARDAGGSATSGYVGMLALGFGIDEQLTIGFTIGAGSGGEMAVGTESGAIHAGALWASFSETGRAGTGVQASVAAAYGSASQDFTRGSRRSNVMPASGQGDLSTTMAALSLGYGFEAAPGWRVTPRLGIAHLSTRRDAYAERGADFNADYRAMTASRTTFSAAVYAEIELTARHQLNIATGFEHDLRSDDATLAGASSAPGLARVIAASTTSRRDTRGFFEAGLTHDLDARSFISAEMRIGQPVYGNEPSARISLSYGLRF